MTPERIVSLIVSLVPVLSIISGVIIALATSRHRSQAGDKDDPAPAMSLWIDAPLWPRHGTVFAHLVSDASLDELHAGAARAGLHPRSFHGDHYDVAQERYDDAVGAGATPTTGAHVVRLLTASGLRLRKRRGLWLNIQGGLYRKLLYFRLINFVFFLFD